MDLLRHERPAQVNLASTLTARRFKTLVASGVVPTKCPKTPRFSRDSFWHLLDCYDLTQDVARGDEVVPFLVRMARKTFQEGRINPIPYTGPAS